MIPYDADAYNQLTEGGPTIDVREELKERYGDDRIKEEDDENSGTDDGEALDIDSFSDED